MLLAAGADTDLPDAVGNTELHLAVQNGYAGVVAALVAAGADVNAQCGQGVTPPVRPTSASHQCGPPRPLALPGDDSAGGADVDALDTRGQTLLHGAARKDNTAAVKLLLEAGAAVDAPNSNSFTALHLAAQDGQGPAVAQLLAAGADLSARTRHGGTPLWYAASEGTPASVSLLLDAGASAKEPDVYGQTPLHVAADKASCCR